MNAAGSTSSPNATDVLFHQLLAEICNEICFRTFQLHMNGQSSCPHCHQICSLLQCHTGGGNVDIYGNKVDMNESPPLIECPNCKKSLAATRFAPHLEKCMGMGRQSARKRNANVAKLAVDTNDSDDGLSGDLMTLESSSFSMPGSDELPATSSAAGSTTATYAKKKTLQTTSPTKSKAQSTSTTSPSKSGKASRVNSKTASPTKSTSANADAQHPSSSSTVKKAKVASPTKGGGSNKKK